jgi:hypothetical protein
MPGVRSLPVEEVEVEEEEEAKGEEDDRGGPRPTGVACLRGSREEEGLFFSDIDSSPSSRRCSSVKPSNIFGGDEVLAAPRQHRLRVKRRIATARSNSLLYFRERPTASLKALSSPFHSHTCPKMCRARLRKKGICSGLRYQRAAERRERPKRTLKSM